MSEKRLSTGEIEQELRDHVSFLQVSAGAYDAGRLAEAKRIALELRVILEFLKKLKVSSSMPFYDSAQPFRLDNGVPHYGLLTIRHSEVLPSFDRRGSTRAFVPWDVWSNQVVLSDGPGSTFTRYKLIKIQADKRAAHIDLTLPTAFARVSSAQNAGYRREKDHLVFLLGDPAKHPPPAPESLLPEPVAPSLRQIAHEVLVSIASYRPGAFENQSEVDGTLALRDGRLGVSLFVSKNEIDNLRGPHQIKIHRSVRSVDGDELG